MSIIASNLHKEYHTRIKDEGLRASLKALVNPVYRKIIAVDDLSFTVEPGEIVAFIGPNGAGKSTTIKMLTGILHPTSGDMRVLNMDPTTRREELALHIGTVFGQRSQLWMHLPPLDSFSLLARIYELDNKSYRMRLAELSELFELQDLLKTPVRKLSLGQRIRCEIAASLLHSPKVIFLDEPTIGLDVIVKQRIRELIALLNREEKTTVFLTSHDAGDVELLAKRALVIDHGRIVIDDAVTSLRKRYLNRKVIEVTLNDTQSPLCLHLPQGAYAETPEAGKLRCIADTRQISVSDLVKYLVETLSFNDLTVSDPPMEDIIAAIFRGEEYQK
ncbi:MAG: ATP-binding cassette domain-containing protein [Symbiobacteriaceae bacterium]|nr:ATP-binding cassette domain-containing protein [Symbiobacteriaceae bacterium]